MGVHLVNLFRGTEDDVYVTSRGLRESNGNIHFVRGNAHDKGFMAELLKKRFDAIVDFMVYSTEEFKAVYRERLDNCGQYMFLSSSRVYASCEGLITEESPRLLDVSTDKDYLKTDEYALAKARQEDILRASGKKNWTIIRPYITYSEIRLQLGTQEKECWLQRALGGHSIVFSQDIAERYTTLTYGLDVARGIKSLIGEEAALGEAFHITTSEYAKWGDILNMYCDSIAEKTGEYPKVVMRDHWERFHGGGDAQAKLDRLFDRRFDNSKIAKYIDVKTFKPLFPTLKECLTGFMENDRYEQGLYPTREAKKDKISGERADLLRYRGIKDWAKYVIVRSGLYDPFKN